MTRTASEIATGYFRAVGSGDRQALADLLADDVVYRFPGRSSFAQEYRGREAVLAYLDRLRDETDGSMRVEIQDVMTSASVAAGHVRATARRKGAELSWSLVALIHPRGEQIGAITLFYDDQYGVDEFLTA